jgi:hypothetical protein
VSAKNAVCVDETFTTMASEIQTRFIKAKGEKTKGKDEKKFQFNNSTAVTLNQNNEAKEPEVQKKNCC